MEHELSQAQSPFATEPVGRLIVKFAVPSVIALLVNSLYNIVDQIFIGNGVGYLGNGATNIVFPITIIALALAMMIGNGGAAYSPQDTWMRRSGETPWPCSIWSWSAVSERASWWPCGGRTWTWNSGPFPSASRLSKMRTTT